MDRWSSLSNISDDTNMNSDFDGRSFLSAFWMGETLDSERIFGADSRWVRWDKWMAMGKCISDVKGFPFDQIGSFSPVPMYKKLNGQEYISMSRSMARSSQNQRRSTTHWLLDAVYGEQCDHALDSRRAWRDISNCAMDHHSPLLVNPLAALQSHRNRYNPRPKEIDEIRRQTKRSPPVSVVDRCIAKSIVADEKDDSERHCRYSKKKRRNSSEDWARILLKMDDGDHLVWQHQASRRTRVRWSNDNERLTWALISKGDR